MSRGLAYGAVAIVAFIVAACGIAASPSIRAASPSGPAGSAVVATPTFDSGGPMVGPATPSAGPPVAGLDGLSGSTAAGVLASYTWDDIGSDGPWVVGPLAGTARAGTNLRVVVGGAIAPVLWQARWALVEGTTVGSPVDGGSGSTGSISIRAPGTTGAWSLAVTASFGTGRSATWTWRVGVGP